MKRKRDSKKLMVRRETLANLDPSGLERAAGGTSLYTCQCDMTTGTANCCSGAGTRADA